MGRSLADIRKANKALRKRPMHACVLLLCYGLMLWVAAFHTHECRHEKDQAQTGTTEALQPNIPAQLVSLAKAYLCSGSSPSEAFSEHCCIDSGLRDCDQTQFVPRSRRAIEKSSLDGLPLGLLVGGEPESGFGLDLGPWKPRPFSFLSPLASIRSVRLLI